MALGEWKCLARLDPNNDVLNLELTVRGGCFDDVEFVKHHFFDGLQTHRLCVAVALGEWKRMVRLDTDNHFFNFELSVCRCSHDDIE
jgi:hypothetical protein